MNTVKKAKKDMLDLEAITKNLEDNYRPVNIELTNYEKEQEESAVISYEELLKKRSSNSVNYDDSFINNSEIDIKKVDLRESMGTNNIVNTKIEVNLFNYEKEEAFLKALRKLQSDLAR